MTKRRVALSTHYWGITASVITLLTGGWLILAPFALGYQRYSGSWTNATKNDFWFGIGVVVVSLVALGLFVRSLVAALSAAGLVQARPRPQPRQAAAEIAQAAPVAPSATAASGMSSDLERTMAVLAAALAADMNERRVSEGERVAETQATLSSRRKDA